MVCELINEAKKLDIEITEEQANKFEKFYKMLIEWNKKINLTAITEQNDVIIKHFIDSISILKYVNIKENAKIIDVGTGAGFPGIPLKIMRNDIELTLLDSLNKRLIFTEAVINELNLSAKTVHLRAEEAGNKEELREDFDIAVSRAVAALPILSEYCLPLVKCGGKFVSMKGILSEEELNSSHLAIKELGGKYSESFKFLLPGDYNRTIVLIDKINKTKKMYPRHGKKIKEAFIT